MTTYSDPAIGILEAAEGLFFSKGYHGTSIRDIASAAGYRSVSALYNYFPDKEAIFRALLDYRSPYPRLLEQVHSIGGDTVAEFLPQIFLEMSSYMQAHSHFFRLALIDYLEFNAEHLKGIINDVQAPLAVLFRRLEGLEGLREDVPPLFLMRFMGMQLFAYLMSGSILPPDILGIMTDEEWKQLFIKVYLTGLESKGES